MTRSRSSAGCAARPIGMALRCAAISGVMLAGCVTAPPPGAADAAVMPTFEVPQEQLATPLVLVAYGDMRFTDPVAAQVSQPIARRALVAKIAAERPAAVLINGDVPLRGVAADYGVFHRETAAWRVLGLRVYPALGNHEFAQCEESSCLDLWWGEFPALRGHRWYSVRLGTQVLCIALDSDASLLPGSEQRTWLEAQVAGRGAGIRFVVLVMHHPPLADVQTTMHVDHNPRPNETALAGYLGRIAHAPGPAAHFLVVAGHIHNYERIERDGVTYLVSGGGGAAPYEVDRTADDAYRPSGRLPNYHYVRLELRDGRLSGEMVRLADYAADEPHQWTVMDRFELGP